MKNYIEANYFEHKTIKNANGDPIRVRRSGQTKLWKTRPTEFKIPYKYGLYDHGYITQDNCNEWNPIN
jgi:hypothetical protein